MMQTNNIYDIIIKNFMSKRDNIMSDKQTKEKWETPKYSKSEINKTGSIIADETSTMEERNQALVILNNWRASHAYPLQVITSNLHSKNPNAIVVQRLKRLDSITGKIKRFPDMNLYRMQDLGGCRVIVDTIDEVYAAIDQYKNSRIRHILKKEYDYIKNPKLSGYRSYHMVYQFHSDKNDTFNKNMLIEIQFRTKLQHIWATAVEMMGIYTKSNLKSSQGNADILRFFTLVSSIFAIQENMPVSPNTSDWMDELIKEIKLLDDKYNIIYTLSSLNVAIDYATTSKDKHNKKNLYYMLILDYEKKIVHIRSFMPNDIEIATRIYSEIENKSDSNVVLVSATSFETLKAAYPNYFVDISKFVDTLRNMIQKLSHI